MPYIYLLTNTATGDTYIGKTEKTVTDRWKKHQATAKGGSRTYLHRAIRKYGPDNFAVSVLEETVDADAREQYWIAEMRPTYNMTEGGEGGDTSASPNFKKSMQEYHSRKTKESYATFGMLGKTHPQKGKPARWNFCPVMCEGTEYESVGAAQKAYPGISIRKRIDNPRYPAFYRLKPRTLRPRKTTS